VGRTESSGQHALDTLKSAARNPEWQRFQYVQGDLGSVQSTMELVNKLKTKNGDDATPQKEPFDFLVVSAGTWPDWSNLVSVDGFERSFGIAVVGRFLLYRNLHWLLKPQGGRVLNILASGAVVPYSLDRDMAMGKIHPTNLATAIINFNTAHEIMLVGLDERDTTIQHELHQVVRVSTHPGAVASDLHRGQSLFVHLAVNLGSLLLGISEEECGLRQASILISDKLTPGRQQYADPFGIGRTRSVSLQKQVDLHLDWVWSFLLKLEQGQKGNNNAAFETGKVNDSLES